MNLRLPTNVLSDLKTIAKDHNVTVTRILEDQIRKVVECGGATLEKKEKAKISETSISVDLQLQLDFERLVKEKGLKLDTVMRSLAEGVVSSVRH